MKQCLIRLDLVQSLSRSKVVKGVSHVPKDAWRKNQFFDLSWPHDYVIALKLLWWPFLTMAHRSVTKSRKMFGDGGTLNLQWSKIVYQKAPYQKMNLAVTSTYGSIRKFRTPDPEFWSMTNPMVMGSTPNSNVENRNLAIGAPLNTLSYLTLIFIKNAEKLDDLNMRKV